MEKLRQLISCSDIPNIKVLSEKIHFSNIDLANTFNKIIRVLMFNLSLKMPFETLSGYIGVLKNKS